jgi:hypothetical protein
MTIAFDRPDLEQAGPFRARPTSRQPRPLASPSARHPAIPFLLLLAIAMMRSVC